MQMCRRIYTKLVTVTVSQDMPWIGKVNVIKGEFQFHPNTSSRFSETLALALVDAVSVKVYLYTFIIQFKGTKLSLLAKLYLRFFFLSLDMCIGKSTW